MASILGQLFSFNIDDEMKEKAEQAKKAAIQKCFARMESFGTLSFGDRHHLWIRHVRIMVNQIPPLLPCDFDTEELKDNSLWFHFQGSAGQFPSLKLYLDEMGEDGYTSTKEKLEDNLAKRFLAVNCIAPSFKNYRCKYDTDTRYRLALYLDYKFQKAQQQ